MTPLQLAKEAKRYGASFQYRDDGTLIVIGLERVPCGLRKDVLDRIDDVRACVREHSVPKEFTGSDVADAARKIVLAERRSRSTAARI
jgi:hypothetical protein